EEDASHLIADSQTFFSFLIQTLCQGSIPLGHLKTILKSKNQFQKLYNQCKCDAFSIIKTYRRLVRHKLIHHFVSSLEDMVKTNLQMVTLDKLVEVQRYFCKEDLGKNNTRRVLFYNVDPQVLDMAREMHEVKTSDLLLSLWREKAMEYYMPGPYLLSLDLTDVHDRIWKPCLTDFLSLGLRIAVGETCFKEVDQALKWCGDRGEGDCLKKELTLMATMLKSHQALDENWLEYRLNQIQEYRHLYHAAESAEVILKIKDKLELQGDFSHIHSLIQVIDDSFKQNTLGSLSDDLIRARKKLADCCNVKKIFIFNMFQLGLKDLKVFMELATISAGENDADIDRLASFETVVMGYGPLLYSLPKHAGFEEFIDCAKQVWDILDKDKKLVDKLVDSRRWLDWLKGLRETHGSVEKSSLSMASDINTEGVYHVGWPEDFNGKVSLDNVFCVKVTKNEQAYGEKTYNLNELLELQNKLMLISKGEHGREQVFEGVQRMGRILLQMRTSGNMLFRNWRAQIICNHQDQPCIQVSFTLLNKCVAYHGEVEDELQKLCRSLENFHKDWCNHLAKIRSQHYALNHYTSEQIVFLCEWINSFGIKRKTVPQQMWHLLTPIKPDCTLNDIREAFEKATETESMVQDDMAEESEQNSDFDLPLGFSLLDVGTECLEDLWQQFKENMSRFLTHHVDVVTLGHFLSNLSAMNQIYIKRKIPPVLQEGRPNLVQCPVAELISTTLSFYTESPEHPLPTADEVFMCQEETTEEEVEIFLRRCLGSQGTASNHQKIYTLVNPGSLTYDVSVALVECFETLEKSAGPHYRLVMVCPVNQDRYVPSFFSNYKVQTGLSISTERIKNYLRHHFRIPSELVPYSEVYPGQLSIWMISSERPAVGKSLYVKRLFEQFKKEFPTATCLTIRLIEPCVDMDGFIQTLSERLALLTEQDPVLLHIDIAALRHGLEEFLFKILILGCLSDSKGTVWRRNAAHLVAIEALQQVQKSQTHMEIKRKEGEYTSLDPLMDSEEFKSEAIQRPYQYLRRFNGNVNLDRFEYQAQSVEGDPVDCLHHLLSNYGLKDPSWAELKHFTWFLNLQLKDCENSLFCDPNFLADNLSGFKDFIVKFMIHMARDFASPSIDISDESPTFFSENKDEEDILAIRKRWENEPHPYIFFNADHCTMSFLGFHVQKFGTILNAVDPRSGKVLMGNVMTQELFSDIERQRINLSENFDELSREDKIRKISFVVGAKKGWEKGKFDPDPTYELTTDNIMKMLAIHMRFRCEIPVIIMGETGCGKTRLIRFLCDLQREGRDVENMKLVKVHGGTTSEVIYRKVQEAEELAQKNRQKYELDTVLFFDEANTTEAIFAIKEVLCDKTVQGYSLKKNSGLKIIAACNPYRRHTPRMIDRLERAGLGYRVKAEETEDRLGKVPMRQLVYRVHPLPPSMVPLVWDFGQLSDSTELSYIYQIVQKQMRYHGLPCAYESVITNVLAASQIYMRTQADECSFVSLRDVERSMCVLVWFYNHRDDLFPGCHRNETELMTLKCLVLAMGVCYYPSLENKETYLVTMSKCFPCPFNSKESLEQEITSCQDFFLEKIQTRDRIAKNLALKENVFLMVVCIELRIPLFLVGKPGSSKSLAKIVVADAMQRQASHCDLFKKLKEVHMVSFQCSPHSSPEGIIGTFRNCARFQKDKNFDEYVSVVVLDEIGLAEDSPQMPLKTLHPLLEDGCIDSDNPQQYMKVGFVGISNWALDPAKMNRGIFVSRWDPSEKDLVETAEGICSSSHNNILLKIKHLLPKLAKGYLDICKTDGEQFFGLRDYYSLVKMIFATVDSSNQDPSDSELAEAVLRNFSGQDDFDPLKYFRDIFQNTEVQRPSTLKMIEQNLDLNSDKECRYLLLLTTNNAALYIIQHHIFSKENYTCPEIVFGSGFPKDQEYAQICRNVSRIKACMETGRTVILLNLLNLYESLYDALNQYYVCFSGQNYVDLGLGSHRVKCRVHKDFRLVVVEDQEKVYKKFPVPLKNRLEKHKVDRSTDLTPWQHRVLEKLKQWAEDFSKVHQSTETKFSLSDAFAGFHGDACASVLLQALEKIQKQGHNTEEQVYETAKSLLLNCASPDSVLRLKYSKFGNQEKNKLQRMYFHQQSHQSLRDLLDNHLNKNDQDKNRFLEVTTFSNLLTKADVRNLAPALGLSTEQSFLKESGLSLHILLVQMDMEESLCKNELIASAKYCTMNEILSLKSDKCNFYTVFITKLNRIGEHCRTSSNKYIGFQGGVWLSAHIDDLRDSSDMTLNLKAFCGIPISKLISQKVESDEIDTSGPETEKGDSVHLHSLSLLRSCTQKAVSLLRDTGKKTSRSVDRMNILFGLLGGDPRWIRVLLRRLVFSLMRKEELMPNANDWVYNVAKNREALQEGGTLRHTLWRNLQGVLTPVFARILEVLDRDCNLYLLYGKGLSEGLAQFWLDIFEDQQLLDLTLHHLHKIMQNSILHVKKFSGSEQDIKGRIQQFVSAVSGSGLGSYIQKLSEGEKVELGQRYLTDYVLLSFKIQSEEEHGVRYIGFISLVTYVFTISYFIYGVRCSVCLSDLSEPAVLPCEHVFCLSCLRKSTEREGANFCPMCREPLLNNYRPTVSTAIDLALKQHKEIRKCCNAFFLELISRFCLTNDQDPADDLVELLFSFLILAQGGWISLWNISLQTVHFSAITINKTWSFQLYCTFSHINYLKSACLFLKADLLFIQDSLFCSGLNGDHRHLKENTNFLSRLARKQTPSRQNDPSEFLLSMGRLRMCLDSAARILSQEVELKLLEQVKAVFEYGNNDWYRVYLLRALNRHAGMDCLQVLISSTDYEWIFPAEILRLIPAEVDRFLCCGQSYRTLRDGVGEAMQECTTNGLREALGVRCVIMVMHCGKPVALSNCATCGVRIGGQNYKPVEGFIEAHQITDMTRPGHILGHAENRSEAPNRNLTSAQSCILRLCLHLAMLQGAIHHQQGIRNMILPNVNDVYEFLWQHLEKDMEVLGKTLDLNSDDSAIIIHLIFSNHPSLCFQDLNRMLGRAQDLIAADNNLSNSPLMKVLRGDPQKILHLPTNCPTHHSAFWSLSPVLTLESFSQQINQSQAPLLTLFINKVSSLKTYKTVFQALVSPYVSCSHSFMLSLRIVEIFMKVWNQLRMEISNNGKLFEFYMWNLQDVLCKATCSAFSIYHYVFPSQLALCHPEKELLPLVLANCHYTLEKGQQTVSSYDHEAIERELSRRFFAGKPRIQTVSLHILQLASVLSSIRSVLRSFTDVCDAVYAVEIGLRFLGKTGGHPQDLLLSYLTVSLKMDQHISSTIAEVRHAFKVVT
uniref:RING-type E3 ubiquitin transferase n=1 Tax=Cyprinus carpio TaxID=7962 RepID=A0A8C1VT74_CYPCA